MLVQLFSAENAFNKLLFFAQNPSFAVFTFSILNFLELSKKLKWFLVDHFRIFIMCVLENSDIEQSDSVFIKGAFLSLLDFPSGPYAFC